MENKKIIDQVKSSISRIPKEKMDIKKIPIEIFLSPLKTKKVKSFDYYYLMNQHYSNYYRVDIDNNLFNHYSYADVSDSIIAGTVHDIFLDLNN